MSKVLCIIAICLGLSFVLKSDHVPHNIKAIQGVWVRKDYIDLLKKTKSPYTASSVDTDYVTLIIDTTNIQGDSILSIGTSNNDHEGGGIDLFLDVTFKSDSFDIDSHSYPDGASQKLFVRYSLNDTVVLIKNYPDGIHVQETVKYERILNEQNSDEANYGITYIINKLLFSNNYNLVDSSGVKMNKKVSFNVNGKVSGLNGFTSYNVSSDFNIRQQNNLDNIWLLKNDQCDNFIDCGKQYGFSFKKDSLLLYNLVSTSKKELQMQKNGTVAFTFVKTK